MALFSILALLPLTLFSPYAGDGLLYEGIPELQAPLHGIYLTSQTVGGPQGEILTKAFRELGGNMIVFDIQDSSGKIAYPSNLPLSLELDNRKSQIADLPKTVEKLHEQGFYVVARFVLFKNGYLAKRKPAWNLKKKGSKATFVSRDGPVWLDPGNPELNQYLIGISREVAAAGVDEIQFDYVRFPEGGKGGYIGYSVQGDKTFSRDQILTNFIAEIANELHGLGVKVSVDVFGIVVWDNVSWKVIGQNVPELAKHVDVIYPMPYPSHFGPGWGGHRNPADEPYFFVQETTKKFVEAVAGTDAEIRPWLQGFSMRVSKYGSNYIREQIRALRDIGIDGFSIWNAANNYRVAFGGLK